MKKINRNIVTFSSILCLCIAIIGCKKYDNPPPVFEELGTINTIQRKVLLISIDGVTGSEIATIAPPNIMELRKTGKYTYNTLQGPGANDVTSWVSMVTGVSYSKHLISDDTFMRPPLDNSHGEIKFYRNSLDYILQYKTLKTGFVTPWNELRNYLKVADYLPVVSTDAAVKDSTINLLKAKTLGALVVNFRDVLAAGQNGGYVATNASYKNAILKADEYVGNIVAAVKARPSYANEDWLVIVTTNHGGSAVDPKPGFFIASQKNIKEQELKKAGLNTVLFNNSGINASVPNDNGLYDPGLTTDFTVQIQTKFNSNVQYPGFLSKGTAMLGPNITGWMFLQSNGTWSVGLGGTNNGGTGKTQISGGTTLGDFQWHTLTMTVKTVAGVRTLTTYTDGVLVTAANITGNKSLSTTEKLTVGYKNVDGGGTALNFQAADLVYFNVALDAATIKNNLTLKDITKHPNYANVTGYWPIDDGAEGLVTNRAPGGYNMTLAGGFTWKAMGTDVPPTMTADPNAASGKSVVVTSSTASALMLYWLNVKILPEFGIDGDPFLSKFEVEFLK